MNLSEGGVIQFEEPIVRLSCNTDRTERATVQNVLRTKLPSQFCLGSVKLSEGSPPRSEEQERR